MLDLPVVRHKDSEDLFERSKIIESLIKETGLNRKMAQQIAKEVHAFVVSNNLKIVTGPLLREISNVFLLKYGYELERLKNTRIGIPMFDLKEMREEGLDMNKEISKHVLKEEEAVEKLIGECDEK